MWMPHTVCYLHIKWLKCLLIFIREGFTRYCASCSRSFSSRYISRGVCANGRNISPKALHAFSAFGFKQRARLIGEILFSACRTRDIFCNLRTSLSYHCLGIRFTSHAYGSEWNFLSIYMLMKDSTRTDGSVGTVHTRNEVYITRFREMSREEMPGEDGFAIDRVHVIDATCRWERRSGRNTKWKQNREDRSKPLKHMRWWFHVAGRPKVSTFLRQELWGRVQTQIRIIGNYARHCH